ncbi:MAG: hypothetical protein QM756_36080 [Polyangiaceae bacterium]
MNRTLKLKLAWAALVAGTLCALLVWLFLARPPTRWAALVGLAFLIPGRIQGYFYRDLMIGRVQLEQGHPREAIAFFERFIEALSLRPGLKKLLWLSWSVYTTDPEVMARNNLGAACLQLGELEKARQWLESARQLDPLAPLVHFNLALVTAVEGDSATADALLQQSVQLGLTRSWHDRFAQSLQRILAAVEGHR